MPSAVIIRAYLPGALERLRRRSIANAAEGVPAHLTLLYPFLEPAGLDARVRRTIAAVAARHPAFEYRQQGLAVWPDTLYVAVAPAERFVQLKRDLQAKFPDFPIYGEGPEFDFVPHISVVEGSGVEDPAVRRDRAWRALPRWASAEAIDVIAAGDDGRWRLVWRIPLGGVRAG